jgi:hypothetical protein
VAARRLIIIMFVLLAISTLAAALAPVREPASTSTQEPTVPVPEAGPAAGELVKARIDAAAKDPEIVRATPGDRLELLVSSPEPAEISIEPLGLIGNASAGAPARFDAALGEPGTLPVTILGGRTIGRVEVQQRRGTARGDRER